MEAGLSGIGTWVAFALTLMVYCYLARDIPFFHAIYRVAAYAFVGVALGYGAVMAWHGVLLPRLIGPLTAGSVGHVVPLVLCLLLLSRVKRSWRGAGQLTIAFLFGVGAALAVGGALVGTLIPQTRATFVSLNPAHYEDMATLEGALPVSYALDAFLVALGTVSTLVYFYFARGEKGSLALQGAVHLAAGFGKVFLMFTFGALFAMAAISRISVLVDRFRFLIETVLRHLPSV
jgi:hypothetical protein